MALEEHPLMRAHLRFSCKAPGTGQRIGIDLRAWAGNAGTHSCTDKLLMLCTAASLTLLALMPLVNPNLRRACMAWGSLALLGFF